MSGYVVGDLGRELYAPLRVLQGQIIYKDFLWLYGPFSLWINTLLYRLFSVNSQVLYYECLVLGLVIAMLVYRLSRFYSSQPISLLIATIYIKVAMFGFTWQSFIMPGKFSALWGMLFSLLFLNHLVKRISVNSTPSWIWLGMIGGVAAIIKVDYAFAILISIFLWICFFNKQGSILRVVLKVISGVIVVASPVAYWMILNNITIGDVLNNIFPAYSSSYWFTHRKFYELGTLLNVLNVESAIIVVVTALSLKRVRSFRYLFLLKTILIIMGIIIIRSQNSNLFKFGFMSPFFIISLVVMALVFINQTIPQQFKRSLLVVTIFNVLLTIRDKLAVGSFSMVFPLLVIVWSLTAIYKYSSERITFNFFTSTILITLIMFKLFTDQSTFLYNSQYFNKKTVIVMPRGQFIVGPSPEGVLFDVVSYLSERRKPIDEMVSFPMEAAIPFFTHIQNPLRYDQFANGLIRPVDQKNVIILLNRYGPRFITVSNYEFLGYFGLDYNEEIYAWILNHYDESARFGCLFPYDKSSDCTGYGIRVFEIKNGKTS